jgi:hypothetical protein
VDIGFISCSLQSVFSSACAHVAKRRTGRAWGRIIGNLDGMSRDSGVDSNLLIDAYRYPSDHAITEVLPAAKIDASTGAFLTDAILFGKWPD